MEDYRGSLEQLDTMTRVARSALAALNSHSGILGGTEAIDRYFSPFVFVLLDNLRIPS